MADAAAAVNLGVKVASLASFIARCIAVVSLGSDCFGRNRAEVGGPFAAAGSLASIARQKLSKSSSPLDLCGNQISGALRHRRNLTHCLISTQHWDFCSSASAAARASGVLPRRAWSILLGRTTASKALSTGAVSFVARRSNATTSRHRSA